MATTRDHALTEKASLSRICFLILVVAALAGSFAASTRAANSRSGVYDRLARMMELGAGQFVTFAQTVGYPA